jgi:hypothetical protein
MVRKGMHSNSSAAHVMRGLRTTACLCLQNLHFVHIYIAGELSGIPGNPGTQIFMHLTRFFFLDSWLEIML